MTLKPPVIGTLTAGPLIERFNHRNTMYFMCGVSFVGIVLEASAKHWQQFMIGRIVVYAVSPDISFHKLSHL